MCITALHIQSKEKAIVASSRPFSSAWRQLHVITSSFDWFTVLSVILLIGLRTFARNFSNIDFFLKILPWKDHELAMSEMEKSGGSPTSFWK